MATTVTTPHIHLFHKARNPLTANDQQSTLAYLLPYFLDIFLTSHACIPGINEMCVCVCELFAVMSVVEEGTLWGLCSCATRYQNPEHLDRQINDNDNWVYGEYERCASLARNVKKKRLLNHSYNKISWSFLMHAPFGVTSIARFDWQESCQCIWSPCRLF
jgi:hypothetical protein